MASEVAVVTAPVATPPVAEVPSTPPTANSYTTESDLEARIRAQATVQQDAVHQAATVLMNALQVEEQVAQGDKHFEDLLVSALRATQRRITREEIELERQEELDYFQAQQARRSVHPSPVDPELLRIQVETLARSL